MKKEETYYEILKVDPRASIADVVAAYHTARNAFSKDSLATYSLFSAEESQEVLKKLEEAFVTLSNVDRKREYDRQLSQQAQGIPPAASSPTPVKTEAPAPVKASDTATPSGDPPEQEAVINGAWLKKAREQRNLSMEDVARLTKIPLSTLKAIELDDTKHWPARVYLHGFVGNLLKVYKVTSPRIPKAYLEFVDQTLAAPHPVLVKH